MQNVGFLTTRLIFQVHWNNPLFRTDYTDSSGMTFYLTPSIRPYDAGVMITGQTFLEIPPGQYAYSTDGGCPGHCTSSMMEGPIYIMEAFNHMHYLGELYHTIFVCLGLYVPVNNFSVLSNGMKCLAQGQNTAPQARFEPATLRSRVRRSTN